MCWICSNPLSVISLRVVFGARKFPGPLGRTTPNSGKVFGNLDDVVGDSGELVLITKDMLDFTQEATVLQLEHHKATLAANNLQEHILTPLDTAPHTEKIQAHTAFFISFHFVPWVIGKGLVSGTPIQHVLHSPD